MKRINNYILEKFQIDKDIKIVLVKNSFIDYIKNELDEDVFHVDNDEVDIYMVHLKDYKNVCDGGYPVPRVDLELESNCFRFYGEDKYVWNDDGELEEIDNKFPLEVEKYKGEYKYSEKNANILIDILKSKKDE